MKINFQFLNPFYVIRWIGKEICDTVEAGVKRIYKPVPIPPEPVPPNAEEIRAERIANYKLELLQATEQHIKWKHTENMAREMLNELGSFRPTEPASFYHPFPPIEEEPLILRELRLVHDLGRMALAHDLAEQQQGQEDQPQVDQEGPPASRRRGRKLH